MRKCYEVANAREEIQKMLFEIKQQDYDIIKMMKVSFQLEFNTN